MPDLINRMKPLLLLVAVLGLASAAQAQYAGSFARFGFGARAISMGGALTADVFGGASPYHNAALAPDLPGQALDVSAALMSYDRELQHLQLSAPLRPNAGIAVGLVHAGVSGIDGRDGSGYHTEDYSTDEFGFFVAFGTRFSERIAAGIGLRLYRFDLFEGVDAPTSLGISLGVTGKVTENLAVAVAADDLLAKYDWDTSGVLGSAGNSRTDQFPVRLRAGAAYRLGENGIITAEVETQMQTVETERVTGVGTTAGVPSPTVMQEDLRFADVLFRVGGEYWLADPIGVRVGYDRLGASSFGAATPSAGFALRQQFGDLDARLDYAVVLEPFATGTMHVLTLHVEL